MPWPAALKCSPHRPHYTTGDRRHNFLTNYAFKARVINSERGVNLTHVRSSVMVDAEGTLKGDMPD